MFSNNERDISFFVVNPKSHLSDKQIELAHTAEDKLTGKTF